jgi:hypothetical protein
VRFQASPKYAVLATADRPAPSHRRGRKRRHGALFWLRQTSRILKMQRNIKLYKVAFSPGI